MERRRFLKGLALACGVAGCGGTPLTAELVSWLRLAHAVPDAGPLRLYLNGLLVEHLNGTNVLLDYEQVSSMLTLNPGRTRLYIEDEGGRVFLDQEIDLAEERIYAVVLHGLLNPGAGSTAQGATVYPLNHKVPRNRFAVRVYHAANNLGPVEVIFHEREKPALVASRLADVTLATNLAFGEVTGLTGTISEPTLVNSAYGDLIVRRAGESVDLINKDFELNADNTLNVCLTGEVENVGLILWY